MKTMQIMQADITHYRGWHGPVSWQPGQHAVLVGPNNAGKSSLLRAVDLALNPYRDAYRDRLEPFTIVTSAFTVQPGSSL
jgi:ABC-type molybdenum transport system ATPase subunit/photorepair protein PhrA